ncbi:hypothetical protein HYU96_00870 [Candidatus Daviesbacteria bacterium]|nr:hypothetical protein [Candidatus Daviesbacteria bacterium]
MPNIASDKKLHQDVNNQLQQLHHPPASLPVNGETPIPLTEDLKSLGVDAGHIIGSTFEDLTSGSTQVRETPSKGPLQLLKNKLTKVVKLRGSP